MSGSLFKRVPFSTLILLVFTPINSQASDVPTPSDVLAILKASADGVDTFQYRIQSRSADSPGDPKLAVGYRRAFASGDRWAVRRLDGEGKPYSDEIRCDGARRYDMKYRENEVDVLEVVTTRNQDKSEKPQMDDALWLIMPDGFSPAQWIERGAKIEIHPGSNGKAETVLIADLPFDRKLKLVLDSDRDYVAKRAVLTSEKRKSTLTVEADKFDRDNGHWYPTGGTRIQSDSRGVQKRTFQLTEFRMNRELSKTLFTLPEKMPPGVVIYDSTVLDAKKRRIVTGGQEGLEEVQRRKKELAKQKGQSGGPIRASREPGEFPLAATCWTIAGVAGIAAVTFPLLRRIKTAK